MLVYRAVAGAETQTVTLAAAATDGGASVAYGPAGDADTALADHQVAVPDAGETLVEVTVTAADGTVRRYRVVLARAAAGANAAPAGLPEISGTPKVGETLTASAAAITDADGTDNASFAWQWLANDGATEAAVADATASTYTVVPADAGRTLKVRVTFTDDKGTAEVLVSAATETVAAVAPDAPGGLAVGDRRGPRGRALRDVVGACERRRVRGDRLPGAVEVGTEAYDGSEASTRQALVSDPAVLSHTIAGLTVGTAYTVRVLAVNAAGAGAAAEATATAEDRVVPALASASVDGDDSHPHLLRGAGYGVAAGGGRVCGDGGRYGAHGGRGGALGERGRADAGLRGGGGGDGDGRLHRADGDRCGPAPGRVGQCGGLLRDESVSNDTPAPENAAPAGLPEISGAARSARF